MFRNYFYNEMLKRPLGAQGPAQRSTYSSRSPGHTSVATSTSNTTNTGNTIV
ncbi:hypothetical protein P4K82_24570 [Bacillus cereus]|nr:hypothetical protein [Bacillus cereus]